IPPPSHYDRGRKRPRSRKMMMRDLGYLVDWVSCLLGLGRGPRRQLVRSTGSGGAEKQFASVREGEIPAVGPMRPVFRLVPIDQDLGAWQQGFLGESTPEQDIRRARFD